MNEWVIGVDLGGTKIEVGLVNAQNQIVDRRRMPTQSIKGPDYAADQIAQAVQALAHHVPDGDKIVALGICSPGPVDHETGMLIDPPNLNGLHNAPLGRMLSERLGIPVALDHDAKATALGEYHYGAGSGAPGMVFIIVGTGVGGAIIDHGQVVRGNNNTAGEIGHIALDREGELCNCGSRGCVETFLAGPWLGRRYTRALAETAGAGPREVDETATGEHVATLAAQGDPLALRVMTEAGKALGVAVATLAMLFDVDLFVVGGSVAKSGDLLLEPARREIQYHAYRSVGSGVKLIASEIGDDGPILGCAWLAREAAQKAAAAGKPAAGKPAVKGTAQTAVQPAEAEITLPSAPREINPVAETAAWEAVQGTIFDIQRFSVHDGPGIRTNVFLKGCSLRCDWCANPESQRPHPELTFSAQRCIRCGQFVDACVDGWISGETLAARKKYGARVNACPTCGIRWVGQRQTAGAVMAEVLRDAPFYENGGGLTLTGGEPTFQAHFCEALLRLAKSARIDTAMETTGHTRWKVIEQLVPFLDHILFDVKHMDSDLHRTHTGADNTLILANLRRLASAGAPVEIRVPLIPGFNADANSLAAIADFVMQTDGLAKEVCLLPYHALGKSKYQSLGRAYPWENYSPNTSEEIEALAGGMRALGLRVAIGG